MAYKKFGTIVAIYDPYVSETYNSQDFVLEFGPEKFRKQSTFRLGGDFLTPENSSLLVGGEEVTVTFDLGGNTNKKTGKVFTNLNVFGIEKGNTTEETFQQVKKDVKPTFAKPSIQQAAPEVPQDLFADPAPQDYDNTPF